MLLQAFDGAIVAITHNKAFADSLRATHVLRVQVCNLSKSYLCFYCITAFVPPSCIESLLQLLSFLLAVHWSPGVCDDGNQAYWGQYGIYIMIYIIFIPNIYTLYTYLIHIPYIYVTYLLYMYLIYIILYIYIYIYIYLIYTFYICILYIYLI